MDNYLWQSLKNLAGSITGQHLRDEIAHLYVTVDKWRAEVSLNVAEIKRLKQDNRRLAGRNVAYERALNGRNENAGKDALIVGRTHRGEITVDTATTFNEVYLPTHGVTLRVAETYFELIEDKGNPRNIVVTPYGADTDDEEDSPRFIAFTQE